MKGWNLFCGRYRAGERENAKGGAFEKAPPLESPQKLLGNGYLISCSRLSKMGELKKSWMVISRPSQIFLMVLI